MDLQSMAERGVAGEPITRAEAHEVLTSSDAELLDLVAAAGRVRRAHFANLVKVNWLVNLKSGLCPEDCGYCSQRLGSDADILKYKWLSNDEAMQQVRAGVAAGARRVCLVASGTKPSRRDVERVGGLIKEIKASEDVEICACLGFLDAEKGAALKACGADAYNHNLNTSQEHYPSICSTHDYADRVDTVEQAQGAGLSPCSGLIAGMGETHEDLVDLAFELRELGSDSIPVNFLLPFDGTPLEGTPVSNGVPLEPRQCLRILAMVRLVNPTTEVRIAAGRESHLRSLQAMGMQIANSIFLGDYLTSEGQPGAEDRQMIEDLGFVIADGSGRAPATPPGTTVDHTVPVRRRGAGTELPANA